MKISVFGTAAVGQTLAAKLVSLGHTVKMGTRNVEKTLAKTGTQNRSETPCVADYLKANPSITLGTYLDAAKDAELILLCTNGLGSLEALQLAADELDGKIVLDISNATDSTKGFPPPLFISNTSSLAETLQNAFPKTFIVKSLNTMFNGVMINPRMLSEDSTVFISGNNAIAKQTVKTILHQFGWKENEIFDLGDISSARGVESLLLAWFSIMGTLKTNAFNFKIVQ
ncbi:NADPH-dependent F420 reductase [Arachidicoccus sp.]|jgi:predicted dinucleotide-binding enzyme|uniref:NADPH-dependent F420 reductase n=1 Tax=Arachidicoccus sp. TaxID=1872624 RepID=UPI003D1D084C